MASITSSVTLTDNECSDILCTALEGGIGYWCSAGEIEREGWDLPDASDWHYRGFNAYDAEDNDELFGKVDLDTVRRGCNLILNGGLVNSYIQTMVLRHFTEDDAMDADAADCVVQAGLFGEIVYG